MKSISLMSSLSLAAQYRQLQIEDPIHQNADGVWVLTRYEDVKAVLNDARFGHAEASKVESTRPAWYERLRARVSRRDKSPHVDADVLEFIQANAIAYLNPPRHTQTRAAVKAGLLDYQASALRAQFEAQANRLLDQALPQHTMDLVANYAYPFVTYNLLQLLGVPEGDHSLIEQALPNLQILFGESAHHDAETARPADPSCHVLMNYFRALIAARRREPTDDFISALLANKKSHAGLTDDEALSNILLIAIAGHGAMYQLISAAAFYLLSDAPARAQLRAEPNLNAAVLQEFVRYACPVQITARVALEDVALGGKMIRRGESVHLALATANRDAEKFSDPNHLDLTTQHRPNLTFGSGIHQCVGAPLARLQATVALEVLLRRLPDLKLQTAQTKWRDDLFHSPRTLWVTF